MNDFNLEFPISLVKKEQRIVVGIATADNIDKAGDIVDFKASLEAFKDWAGNIREMHSPIAVGKAINYEPIVVKGPDGEEYNAIKVEAYISKGAQDTWEKVLDGTLRAFSIGGSVVEKEFDSSKIYRGKPVNVIKKYRLGELSLVDNPANALAIVDIIKRDNSGNLNYILEDTISKKGGLTTWFEEEWVDISRPKKGGGFEPCGRNDASEGKYPKCVPASKAASMTQEEIRSAIRRKRRAQSTQQREDKKPIMVSTMAKESMNVPVDTELYNRIKQEAKRKFDVYPSAYANAWLVQEYKRRGGKYKTISKSDFQEDFIEDIVNKVSEYKDPKGGLTAAGRRHFKQTEGANLKPGVKGPADTPEKMRRKGSFLTRFFTNPSGPMKDEKGRPTRLALSAAAWGEPVPQNAQDAAALAAKGRRLLERYANAKNKSIDDLIIDLALEDFSHFDNFIKEGEVTTGSMDAGLKNPMQGYPKKRKIKKIKEKKMKKDAMESTDLVEVLKHTLSNAIILYFAAHRAHWNVEGADFFEYHSLFEKIYEDVYASADPFAENIRKLGGFPYTIGEMEDCADFEDDSDSSDAKDLTLNLYLKNYAFIDILKNAFNMCSAANEQGIANFIAERIDAHQTWSWQLKSSLMAHGVDVPVSSEEDEMDDQNEEMNTDMGNPSESVDVTDYSEIDTEELLNMIRGALMNKFDTEEKESKFIKMQDELLQNDVQYDTVRTMNEQDVSKLSLIKRMVNWLVPDVQNETSTYSMVEENQTQQEEEMDIEVLKEALGSVVDQKLAVFASSIKEEVEGAVQEKIDDLAKSFETKTLELQEKLDAAEVSLAEREEEIKTLGKSGALKKSVDPEDEEGEEELVKSQPESIWENIYLPQGLIGALGYRS